VVPLGVKIVNRVEFGWIWVFKRQYFIYLEYQYIITWLEYLWIAPLYQADASRRKRCGQSVDRNLCAWTIL